MGKKQEEGQWEGVRIQGRVMSPRCSVLEFDGKMQPTQWHCSCPSHHNDCGEHSAFQNVAMGNIIVPKSPTGRRNHDFASTELLKLTTALYLYCNITNSIKDCLTTVLSSNVQELQLNCISGHFLPSVLAIRSNTGHNQYFWPFPSIFHILLLPSC